MKKSTVFCLLLLVENLHSAADVKQNTVFGLVLKGHSNGNPFTEVQISSEFILVTNRWNKETYLIKDNDYFLHYYDNSHQAKARTFLPKENKFRLEIIGAWNMIIPQVKGVFISRTEIPQPRLRYIAAGERVVKGAINPNLHTES